MLCIGRYGSVSVCLPACVKRISQGSLQTNINFLMITCITWLWFNSICQLLIWSLLNFLFLLCVSSFFLFFSSPRVQPGQCYHLFTHHRHSKMAEFQVAEMLRTPLEELVLQIKILRLGGARDLLSKAIESPSDQSVINAINTLMQLVNNVYMYCSIMHV